MPTNESPTYAALDLGSNSFHLLIARCDKGKIEVLDRHKEMVRLAAGLQDGSLSTKSIDRALEALQRFAERLRAIPYEDIRVVGTSTLRNASNADAFLRPGEKILGTTIHIISGIEEARLIYRGVANDYAPQAKRLVIDIGGGSTELILGNSGPGALESLDMGCVSFSQEYFSDGKLNKKRYSTAVNAARIEAQDYVKIFGAKKWAEAVGSSGTIKAIESMLEALGLTEDHSISAAGLEALADKIVAFEHVDKIDLPTLSDARKPVIIGGIAVLQGLFLELGIERMHVSGYAVREGLILDLADRGEHHDVRGDTVTEMMQRYRVDTSQVQRVYATAQQLLKQNRDYFGKEYQSNQRRLESAIRLHEIGLAIAHSGFHKHGAYLLENSDMPGFSKQEQKHLSFLVLNQRRKLCSFPESSGFVPNWDVVLIMRLACLLNRRRDDDISLEAMHLELSEQSAKLAFSQSWMDTHPLTMDMLAKEIKQMSQQNYTLELSV